MKMDLIIPTLNEEEYIQRLLTYVFEHKDESLNRVWVVDGGSTDKTLELVKEFDVSVVNCDEKNRAVQMNAGAQHSETDVLYFVHADTLPPKNFIEEVKNEWSQGAKIGGFRFKFDSQLKILKLNSWFTRFNFLTFRGGDQSLFIDREFYDQLGGFDEDYCIMEEYDLIMRAQESGEKFRLMKNHVMVSDRKYRENGYFKVNYANLIAMKMFNRGEDPKQIKSRYFNLLNHPKDI